MGNCLLLRGIKSSASEGIRAIPSYYLHVLLHLLANVSIFKQKYSLFLLQHLQIGQATKLNCKYKASCLVSTPRRPAREEHGLSSSSGLLWCEVRVRSSQCAKCEKAFRGNSETEVSSELPVGQPLPECEI